MWSLPRCTYWGKPWPISILPWLLRPQGADGLVFLPFLNGERTPDLPHARGTLTRLSSTNFTAGGLIRAAVEGVGFGILNGLDRIMQDNSPEEIQVVGGGARSREWRQLRSDATGAKVALPTEQEPGCLGAAIQAHVAWSKSHGITVSFQEVVGQMIPTGPVEILSPNLSLRTAYDDARMWYLTKLREVYPKAD
jgi:xylulokinase